MYTNIFNYIDEIEDEIINIRRDFHKYPETAWNEYRTASLIARTLDDLGFEIYLGKDVIDEGSRMGLPTKQVMKAEYNRALNQGADRRFIESLEGGFTGVVAELELNKEGINLGFRFDIDAIPIDESKSDEHFPYKEEFCSFNEGIMHSCGHDAHASIGIGIAKALLNIKDELKNIKKIKFIFQPAEEGVRGAKSMVEKGIIDDLDYLFASHIGMIDSGSLVCGCNGFLSSTKIDARFKGESAHAGGNPNEGKNALMGACNASLNIMSIPRHKDGVTRINVGKIESGSTRNAIPKDAFMMIETRGQTNKVNNYVKDKVINILRSTALMYDLDLDIDIVGEAINCNSNSDLSQIIYDLANEIGLFENVIKEDNKVKGSEDFTYMLNRMEERNKKSIYMIIGSNIKGGHHNSKFDIYEEDMIKAIKLYLAIIYKMDENIMSKNFDMKEILQK
ncbi:MAG: amidohydrolase [Peptostreptococcaceae bacterium]|jgi:aminobenzoyl-glutamate utilization protein A|nr:amidohydrolase [Peptostreptococcaceae bacterium]